MATRASGTLSGRVAYRTPFRAGADVLWDFTRKPTATPWHSPGADTLPLMENPLVIPSRSEN